jgi:hypothetical protein
MPRGVCRCCSPKHVPQLLVFAFLIPGSFTLLRLSFMLAMSGINVVHAKGMKFAHGVASVY